RKGGRSCFIGGVCETPEVKGGGVPVIIGDERPHARRRGRAGGPRCACHSRGGKRRARCREHGGFIAVRACNGRDARAGGCGRPRRTCHSRGREPRRDR